MKLSNKEGVFKHLRLNRITAIVPPLKRTKNDARGRDRVEKYREIVAGLELPARHQRTLERADSYPNSNWRLIVRDCSLFC